MKQHQHPRRLQPSVHPQQPQKCPRCDSLNTKFCYYNNYSLSQPRHFCRACRRYWTHGGTLRNVPVGGGLRKGKRLNPKEATSSGGADNSAPQPSPAAPPPPPQGYPTVNSLILPTMPATPPAPSYVYGGGFLASLAGMQALSHPAQTFNLGGSSRLAQLQQGFNAASFSSKGAPYSEIEKQNDFPQMGIREKMFRMEYSLYPLDPNSAKSSLPGFGPTP